MREGDREFIYRLGVESFNETHEQKQHIQCKKFHIYSTVWFDSSVTGCSDAAIQD